MAVFIWVFVSLGEVVSIPPKNTRRPPVARRFLSVRASKANYTRDRARVRIRGRRP